MTSHPPTVAQINAQQKADAEQATLALQARQDEAATAHWPGHRASLQRPPTVVDEAAFDQNLLEWGSGRGTPLSFNGMEGGFQTTGGEKCRRRGRRLRRLYEPAPARVPQV